MSKTLHQSPTFRPRTARAARIDSILRNEARQIIRNTSRTSLREAA